MTSVTCISHSQDVDGIVCAALLKMAKNAVYVLTDYPNLLYEIKRISTNVDEVYICDLSLGYHLMNELRRVGESSKVVYIDHHPLEKKISENLRKIHVEVIHSIEKCAGMLTYQLLKNGLPGEASFLAACATLSDYPSSSHEVSLFLERFEPQLLAFESSLLYYAIARAYDDDQFRNKVVDGLSRLKYPHEIDDVIQYAKEQISYSLDLVRNVDNRVSYGKNLAYIEVLGNVSVIANALVQISKKPTVVCYGKYRNGTEYVLAVRNKNQKYDLGATVSKIAGQLGGYGGGHPLAAGAQLPLDKLREFINALDNALCK